MSAELSAELPIENTVVSTETAGKKTRVKKPVLAVKLLKYLDFGFQVVQNLHSAGLLNDEGLDLAFAQIKLLSSVEDQTAFYSNFLDQSNDTAKILRKFVAAKLKPVPVKKPRAKKAAKTDTNTDTTHPSDQAKTPPKAPRVTKSKKTTRTVADADDDIIGALAQAARGEPTDCIVQQAVLRPLPSDDTSREPTDCIVQQADLRPLPSHDTSREPTVPLRPLPSDNTTVNTTEPVFDAKTKKPRKKPEPKAKVSPEPQVIPQLAPSINALPTAVQGVVGLHCATQSPTKKPEPKAKVSPKVTPTELPVELATPITPVVATEPVSDTKTKKPRKKPQPKAKVATEVTPTDDDTQATEITIDNRLFLIDLHNQLYDPLSFNLIAHFSPTDNSVLFI